MSLPLVALLLVFAAPARADIPPPDTSACRSAAASAVCKTDDGANGTCAKDTCSGLDYSNGVPPSERTYECLVCKAGPSSAAPAASSSPCATVDASGSALAVLLGAVAFFARRGR